MWCTSQRTLPLSDVAMPNCESVCCCRPWNFCDGLLLGSSTVELIVFRFGSSSRCDRRGGVMLVCRLVLGVPPPLCCGFGGLMHGELKIAAACPSYWWWASSTVELPFIFLSRVRLLSQHKIQQRSVDDVATTARPWRAKQLPFSAVCVACHGLRGAEVPPWNLRYDDDVQYRHSMILACGG